MQRKRQFGLPLSGSGRAEKEISSPVPTEILTDSPYPAGSVPARNTSVASTTSKAARRRFTQTSKPACPVNRRKSSFRSTICPEPRTTILASIDAEDTVTSADLLFQLWSSARPRFSRGEVMFLLSTQDGIARAIRMATLHHWNYSRPLKALLALMAA